MLSIGVALLSCVLESTVEYTTGLQSLLRETMTRQTEDQVEVEDDIKDDVDDGDDGDDGEPKFGRLLIFLILAVIFCGVLTWVMGHYFPDFPNFS
ncbi:MAG: hypothetical protein ACI83P_000034 [Janthinobacterium sp.]|jgi:hypothetical protein